MSFRAAPRAGASPKAEAGRQRQASENASTRTSGDSSSETGIFAGSGSCSSAAVAATTTAKPPAAPRRNSTRISVRSCRSSRPRPAPSAARTAISRRRAVYRAESIAATFTPAISSTSAAAPSSTLKKPRAALSHRPGTRLSGVSATARTARGVSAWPDSTKRASVIADSSARAAARSTPGQPAEQPEPGRVGQVRSRAQHRLHHQRGPRIDLDARVDPAEGGRRDADHREGVAVDQHGGRPRPAPRADRWSRTHARRRHRMESRRLVLVCGEEPAQGRPTPSRSK